MNITFVIVLVIVFFCIFCYIIYNQKKKNEKLAEELQKKNTNNIEQLKQFYRKETEQEQEKFNSKKENLLEQWKTTEDHYKEREQWLQDNLKEKEKRYNEVNQDLNLYKQGKIKEIDSTAAEYEKHKYLEIKQALEESKLIISSDLNNYVDSCTVQKAQLQSELDIIKKELEEERNKRQAINEEIRRQEEAEKYNEMHSVSLTDNEKDDIHFLLSLKDRMHNKQILYKLVWSTYLQQAYKNTFNNILGGKDPKNVIYCIENVNNGKKYIGKTSAEVSKRWTEHIKTSLNIGTIKNTNIHKALYNHWDDFIFYIIEETERDKLSEREKYYINFYESDKYGYNIKAGG